MLYLSYIYTQQLFTFVIDSKCIIIILFVLKTNVLFVFRTNVNKRDKFHI